MSNSTVFDTFKNSANEFLSWAASNPVVQGVTNFVKDPLGGVRNLGQDIQTTFTGYDPRIAHFSSVDENGDVYEYDLSSGGYIYKTPSGEHTTHRGYAYLDVGNDGRLKLNVSKSVADSDWFKSQFTENDTFKKVIKMFNANPASATTLTTTDKDGNIKNVTLAEAVKQYNDALNQYAHDYEGVSYLRDFYNENTGLKLTDEQIRISENSLKKDEDKNNDSKVINIPDSWSAIYDFKKLPSWDDKTKTVSAKDFFDVYNLDEKGSLTEEQWNALTYASEAELENAFSGRTAANLNTEDPEAVKAAGDRFAKAVAAAKTLNNSRPDVSFLHATAIFTSAVGEQFVSALAKTYGNIGDFIGSNFEWLANSPSQVISWTGERAQDVIALSNVPAAAMLTAMGSIAGDIAEGRLTPETATDYVAEVKEAVENLWASTHGDMDYRDYKIPFLGNRSTNEISETFDTDLEYMEKISKAAVGGKFVGNLLELAVEVWITEATGTAIGKAIETTGLNIGRGLGLAFKGSKIKDQANLVTKLYMAANKATAFTGNMMVQGFMDTVESDASSIMSKMLTSKEVTDEEKKELYNAMTANTIYNVGSEIVISGLMPKFLETKPGRFIQTRTQKIVANASIPFKKGQIGLAKLINGMASGKTPSKALMDAADKYAFAFGVNTLNEYNVKIAEANLEATKQIAKAKEGKEYFDAITGNTIKATSTTKAIETAVMNKMYYQNMIDRISRGLNAEVDEIMKSPDIARASDEASKANIKVMEAEAAAGKTVRTMETGNGGQVSVKAQDDVNYLIHKNRLETMNSKEAALKAEGKELTAHDKEFQEALRSAVDNFVSSNNPKLVEALNNYYQANLNLNKALTDWEVINGLMPRDVYESLKSTGYFGIDDELYMKTMKIDTKGAGVTETYESFINRYAKEYSGRDFYRVNPTYDTAQHLSRSFDPDANYYDPQLVNFARINSMAQAKLASDWGKALKGVGLPMNEMNTLGKPTTNAEVRQTMEAADGASKKAIEKLQKEQLQPNLEGEGITTIGSSFYEQNDLEKRIPDLEKSEAGRLGIKDAKQISGNVSKELSDEQIAADIAGIKDAPEYGKVRTYDEYANTIENMPTKEMKAKANNMMKKQSNAYNDSFKQREKQFEATKKERLKQADKLESEASKIDKDIVRIEKNNASGQAKYEKAKANAEKKIKAAEEKAKKAAAKAQKAGGAEAAEKQLKKDMRDAILYRSGVDIDDGFFPYDITDVPGMFKESRMDQLDEIKIKKGVDLKNLSKTKKMPKPEDIFEKEYIDSVKAKYATAEPAAQPVSTPEIKMPDQFVPTDTADKVAEAAAKREEAARIKSDVDNLKTPRRLSEKQQAVKAWNDAVKNTTMVKDLNRMWLQDAIAKESKDIPESVMAEIKSQIAYAKIARNTEENLINERILNSKDTEAVVRGKIEKWKKGLRETQDNLERLRKLLKLKGEGLDPFTRASDDILDVITTDTKAILEGNSATKRIVEMAKEKGIDPDLVKDYMSVNSLLKENGNGDLVLRDDVKKAIKERMMREFSQQIKAEGDLKEGMQQEAIKSFQKVIEETAKTKWSTAQKNLVDAGGNEFIDMTKNFNFVRNEMEKIVGQFHTKNVVPMMDSEGAIKYYEVSPLVADLYMNRPLANYGKVSEFFNKTSRIARISKTNLNATSVMNQCFRDPLNAYIGAGMYKGFKAYEKEMAELFGPELVAQLQDSMSKAGWDIFTEGGTIAGKELEKKAAKYLVEDTGVNTFVKDSTENALYDSQRTALRGAKLGALDNIEAWNKQYKKAKMSLNEFADKAQRIAGAPGYFINEGRETWLRKADYAAAYTTALKQGKTVLEAKNVAEFVSRQATTNFGRTFMWGNSIVNAVPFLGAAINGSASFWRLVAMDPVGIMSRFVTTGLATMSIVAQSMTTKRDREAYKTIPEWMKQENLAFVYDGEVFKIPIPQELGAFLAPFRQAVEKSNPGVQSHGWLELLCNDLLEVSPISLDGFETLDEVNIDGDPTIYERMSREASALISQLAPPLIKTAYMATVGVDPYTGNPIDTSYKWVDDEGNIQIMDNTQSSFAHFISDKLNWFGEKKSASFWYKTLDSFFGSGLMNLADGVTNVLGGDPIGGTAGFIGTQIEKGLNSVNVGSYQLQDPYLREFKATIKELEDEKNKMLSPDGDLALISQQLSSLKETDTNYETKKKNLIQQYNQATEDYRQRVLNTVQNYNNHYGSTYTINQFASVTNLLVFQESTMMPMNAYQNEQLSQMYYSAREQAYQTMIDMGFDSPDDWSIFGVARRNRNTGEVYVKYASPTAILNMDNVAMGAGKVYSSELEQALKNAGLTKSKRFELYNAANAKGKKAVKQFKQEWNAAVAQTIADTMYKYGPSNVIGSGDATSLLNEYFYISNTSYKVRDYLEDVFGKEDE